MWGSALRCGGLTARPLLSAAMVQGGLRGRLQAQGLPHLDTGNETTSHQPQTTSHQLSVAARLLLLRYRREMTEEIGFASGISRLWWGI
jgi:hypothetical protein